MDHNKLWTGSKLGKEYIKAVYCHPAYLNYIESRLDEAQAISKFAGRNITNLKCADDITPMAETKEKLKCLLMKVKEESEKAD